MTDIQKTLDTLAREINTEHTACEIAANAAVTHALRAGGLLTEVKGRLSHGEWGPWLVKNFAGSSRTARVYMRLHAHRDEIEAKRQSSATLSIDSALKALAVPREDHSLEYHQRKATEHLQNARQACFSLAQDLVALDQHLGPLGHEFVPYVQAAYAVRGLDYIAQDLVDKRGKVHDVFTLASVIFERLPDGLAKVVEE